MFADFKGVMVSGRFTCVNEVCYSALTSGQELRSVLQPVTCLCRPDQVQLTWDETDHERVTALNRKFNKDELLEMDFRAYLASSSEEEEEEECGGDGAFEEDVKTAAGEKHENMKVF